MSFISIIETLSKHSKLKHFLANSYSFELLIRLLGGEGANGIANLYDSILSGKPKQSSFDRYLLRLEKMDLIQKVEMKDRRKVEIRLIDDVLAEARAVFTGS